jgi:GTPase SAR1 family protein
MLKNTREGVKVVLIGNKCDMQFKREVNSEIAEAMAISHGLKYFETSAKENTNLDKVFYEISRDIFSEVNKHINKSLVHYKSVVHYFFIFWYIE